jgi:hypothetical protein
VTTFALSGHLNSLGARRFFGLGTGYLICGVQRGLKIDAANNSQHVLSRAT